MKLAVIGSRNLVVDLTPHIPAGCTAIISGGARGIDTCAKRYAQAHGLELIEFLPDYPRFGRAAPIKRNRQIVEAADEVLAIWDGVSPGTKFTIALAKELGKKVTVITP